jgi:hypothetical protein
LACPGSRTSSDVAQESDPTHGKEFVQLNLTERGGPTHARDVRCLEHVHVITADADFINGTFVALEIFKDRQVPKLPAG